MPAERSRRHWTAEPEQSPTICNKLDQAPLDGKNSVYEIYSKGKVSALVCVMAEQRWTQLDAQPRVFTTRNPRISHRSCIRRCCRASRVTCPIILISTLHYSTGNPAEHPPRGCVVAHSSFRQACDDESSVQRHRLFLRHAQI